MIRWLAITALLLSVCTSMGRADEPVYELRIYKCHPGKLPGLHSRFQNHTLGFFEKYGMKNIAYWTPTTGSGEHDTLIYLLEHASPDAAKASWAAFRDDADWKQISAESQKDGPVLVEKGITSTQLQKVDFSPAVLFPETGKCYELRTYTAADGRLQDLLTRFRNHTDVLFQKHGIKAIGYWIPTDEPAHSNTLIYVLQHESPEAAQASWKAFIADPDWQAAKAESEKNGKLTAKPPEATYLKLTEYSPHR